MRFKPNLSAIANSIGLFSPERQSAGRVLKAKADIAEAQLARGITDRQGVPLMVGNRKRRRVAAQHRNRARRTAGRIARKQL